MHLTKTKTWIWSLLLNLIQYPFETYSSQSFVHVLRVTDPDWFWDSEKQFPFFSHRRPSQILTCFSVMMLLWISDQTLIDNLYIWLNAIEIVKEARAHLFWSTSINLLSFMIDNRWGSWKNPLGLSLIRNQIEKGLGVVKEAVTEAMFLHISIVYWKEGTLAWSRALWIEGSWWNHIPKTHTYSGTCCSFAPWKSLLVQVYLMISFLPPDAWIESNIQFAPLDAMSQIPDWKE